MAEPLAPNAPVALASFERKWNRLAPLFERAGVDWTVPARIDLRRVVTGQLPMSEMETAVAAGLVPIEPPRSPRNLASLILSLPSAAVRDVRQIAAALPRMVPVPDIPALARGQFRLAQPGILGELGAIFSPEERAKAQNIFEQPGIRLLPFTFTLGRLAEGDWQSLLEHPVMTALDVAPAAQLAVPESLVARAAKAAEEAGKAPPTPLRALWREGIKPRLPESLTRWSEQALTRIGMSSKQRDLQAFIAQRDRQVAQQMMKFNEELQAARERYGLTIQDIEDLSRKAEVGNFTDLTPAQRSWLEDVYLPKLREFQELATSPEAGHPLIRFRGELYDEATGRQLLGYQKAVSRAERKVEQVSQKLEDLRSAVEAEPDVQALRAGIEEASARVPDLLKGYPEAVAAWRADLMAKGFKGQVLHALRVLEGTVRGRINDILTDVQKKLTLARQKLNPNLVAEAAQQVNELLDWFRGQGERPSLAGPVQLGRPETAFDFTPVFNQLDEFQRRLVELHGQLQGVSESLRRAARAKPQIPKLLDAQKRHLVALERAQAELEDKIARTPPPRFLPLLQRAWRERIIQRIEEKVAAGELQGRDVAPLFEQIRAGITVNAPLADKELNALWNEVARTWQGLKAAGLDPVYIHHVDWYQLRSLWRPGLFPAKEMTPTQLRQRMREAKAYIPNMEVGLSHMALEWTKRQAINEVIDFTERMWGKPRAQVIREYAAELGPDLAKVENTMLRDGWVEWDPSKFVPWGRPVAAGRREALMVPSWVQKLLEDQVPVISGLRGLLDRANNLFRVSVLALAPRWHIYNVLGGYIATSAIGSPIDVFRYFSRAKSMIDRGEIPVEVARGAGTVHSAEEWLWHYRMGQSLADLMGKEGNMVTRRAQGLLQASFRFNAMVDDFYRSVAFLSAKDRALAKGMTRDQAVRLGIEAANRVLQNWDRMTPVERQVIRMIFPFYGWMRHILGFTLSLPIDHPLRMAILSNWARNEIEDHLQGLPERFWSQFVIGQPDEQGRVLMVNLRGANPFADVANYATLAGFVNQLNPIFGGVLESLGIDPLSGAAEAFPHLVYDPQAGRLRPETGNLIQGIVGNTVPLAGLAWETLTGADLRRLAITNPDAYRARLVSAVGLPSLPRRWHLPTERGLAALARAQAMREAWSRALRTGRYGEAEEWPQLRPLVEQIRQASPEQLAPISLERLASLAA